MPPSSLVLSSQSSCRGRLSLMDSTVLCSGQLELDDNIHSLEGFFDNRRTDLIVTCSNTSEPGRQIINCTSTNPLMSLLCAYDSGQSEECSFPITLSIERFGTSRHILVVTATDGFGQRETIEFSFQLDAPIILEDSVVADPQFTVSIPDDRGHSLCYEVHGDSDHHFNLISDTCLSVNALFTSISPVRNTMSMIGVRAVSKGGSGCVDIKINSTCGANVFTGGSAVGVGDGMVIGGVDLQRRGGDWRISVPNCGEPSVVMRVSCTERQGLRLAVMRGANLQPTSHGLLGQFWNIPISVTILEGQPHVQIFKPDQKNYRRFPAELSQLTWDRSRQYCYYAGDSQGSSERVNQDPTQSVIEGVWTNYVTSGPFDTNFKYKRFEDNHCL
ncbi:hypothetical protein GBAR_LOCUS12460 [Geodia barretti]|uniref:Uncharacterized protein n=1 Tax=Geodia barretti TaxID=519541 RepID=A0AA35S2V3_GEOBA|nr:hypothetical protein GBAR_LOCUS12460 [Geodia barretti]